jgi:hypothetical protein
MKTPCRVEEWMDGRVDELEEWKDIRPQTLRIHPILPSFHPSKKIPVQLG